MKDARLQLRLDPDLKRRVEVEAERRGQKVTTFVERALESALGSGHAEEGSPPVESRPAPSRASAPKESDAMARQRKLNERKFKS